MSRDQMRIHPAAMALPDMSPEEFHQLVEDIRVNGLMEPIELLNGRIIDGRHRYKACAAAGIEPHFTDIDLGGVSPAHYVWSRNGVRRHLTPSQRACVAAELLPGLEKEAKKRQAEQAKRNQPQGQKVANLPPIEKARSRDEAARVVGVAPRYVSDAKALKEKAPDVFEQVKAGKRKLRDATRQTRPAKPEPKYSRCKLFGDIMVTMSRIEMDFIEGFENLAALFASDEWSDGYNRTALNHISECRKLLNRFEKELRRHVEDQKEPGRATA